MTNANQHEQSPAETVDDYELPYDRHAPTSYDAEAVAALLAARADYCQATGGGRLLGTDVLAMLGKVTEAFAQQFRDVGP